MVSDVSRFNVSLMAEEQSHGTVSMDHVLNFWRERWAEVDSNLGPSAADGTASSSIQGRPHHHTGKRQRYFCFIVYIYLFFTIFIISWWTRVELQFYTFLVLLYLLPISIVFWLSQPRSVSSSFHVYPVPRSPSRDSRFSEAHPEQVGTKRQFKQTTPVYVDYWVSK